MPLPRCHWSSFWFTTFGDKTILDDLNTRASLKKSAFCAISGLSLFWFTPLKDKTAPHNLSTQASWGLFSFRVILGPCSYLGSAQRPKNSKLSGWQNLTRKNVPDRAHKSFLRHMHQKSNIYIKMFLPFSEPSGKFADHLESFQTIWNGKFPDHLESFKKIWKVSWPSRKVPEHPESFQTIWKALRPSGIESFQTIWKVSRTSGEFPDHPKSVQTIRKIVFDVFWIWIS